MRSLSDTVDSFRPNSSEIRAYLDDRAFCVSKVTFFLGATTQFGLGFLFHSFSVLGFGTHWISWVTFWFWETQVQPPANWARVGDGWWFLVEFMGPWGGFWKKTLENKAKLQLNTPLGGELSYFAWNLQHTWHTLTYWWCTVLLYWYRWYKAYKPCSINIVILSSFMIFAFPLIAGRWPSVQGWTARAATLQTVSHSTRWRCGPGRHDCGSVKLENW